MKTKIFFLLTLTLFFLCFVSVHAQRFELGPLLGGSYYLGDINPKKHFQQTKPAFGALFRYNLTPRISVKMNGYYGNVAGDDALTKFNQKRNLHFKSHIMEFGAQLELNFLPYVTGHKDYYFAPYIFAGISAFGYNPKALYEGNWIELQPLGTEGQGTVHYYDRAPYNLVALAIPFGVGFKYSISKNIACGFEWGMRKTNTDYLDDISTTYADPNILSAENTPLSAIMADRSIKLPGEPHNTGLQRGNSKNDDWYSFFGAFITFKVTSKGKSDCPAYRKPGRYKDYFVD